MCSLICLFKGHEPGKKELWSIGLEIYNKIFCRRCGKMYKTEDA